EVAAIAVCPTGSLIVTACRDGPAQLWDVSNGNPVSRARLQHAQRVSCVAFSPDGSHIVTGSRDGTARVWETESGELVTTVRHDGSVLAGRFYSQGKRGFAASAGPPARAGGATTGANSA